MLVSKEEVQALLSKLVADVEALADASPAPVDGSAELDAAKAALAADESKIEKAKEDLA